MIGRSRGIKMHKPRVIIMRHSERLDFALGSHEWPAEAFSSGSYAPTAMEMPTFLPLREDPMEYSLDTPLSRHGRAHARHTGEFFRSVGLIPNRVYTSPAMRCVQTADAVLDGIGIRNRVSLRLDLALHEPTRIDLPIQTSSFFSSAGFLVDNNYRANMSPRNGSVIVNESRAEYHRRMYEFLRRVIAKLINQNVSTAVSAMPPTILIVTHRPCVTLLAAFLNIDEADDKIEYLENMLNNRGDVRFLSMVVAEFDPATRLWSFLSEFPKRQLAQPFKAVQNRHRYRSSYSYRRIHGK